MPAPYTVNLVSPDVLSGREQGKKEDAAQESAEPAAPSDISTRKNKKDIVKEKEMLEKKISTIAAKKKIEKLVKLRSIISLKATGDKRNVNSKITSSSPIKGTPSDNYYSKIMEGIQPYWSLPPGMVNKAREAIVSIRILRDGTVIVQKIEQSSGNKIIDRAALSALAKASPLSPPPYEMEIGVRFYP